MTKSKQEVKALFDKYHGATAIALNENVSRQAVYKWIKVSGFDLEKWKANNKPKRIIIKNQKKEIKLNALNLPSKEEAMLILKRRLEKQIKAQIYVYGEANTGTLGLYEKIWGKGKRQRTTVELAFDHLLAELQKI